ncbi:MAG TPA: amidohydrolase family protein [Geminicoccaceae bacterium]|nr:amidohydrolase family protein [Geminicoccaceae bacterium]
MAKNGEPVIDMHGHAQIKAADELIRKVFSPEKEPFVAFASPLTNEVNRRQLERVWPKLTSVEVKLADMDAMGIDLQVVSPSPFQCAYWTEPDLGVEIARVINDGIAALVEGQPRLIPFAGVPLQAPARAADELSRCVEELGMRGVFILTNVAGTELSQAGLDPFFARAVALDVPVFIHPHGFTEARRLSEHYFNNVIGNPLDTTIALAHLIFDGVLERFPGLKIFAAHGGGYLPAYAARMDHAWHAREDCRQHISAPPTTYLKRVYFDTVVFSAAQLEYLIRQYGADHVLLGTDYPYDMGEEDPVGHVESVPGLSDAERRLICHDNAARLLKLQE